MLLLASVLAAEARPHPRPVPAPEPDPAPLVPAGAPPTGRVDYGAPVPRDRSLGVARAWDDAGRLLVTGRVNSVALWVAGPHQTGADVWDVPGWRHLGTLADDLAISDVAVSGDGSTVAVGGVGGELRVYRGSDRVLAWRARVHADVEHLELDATGSTLLSGSADELAVWDVATGRLRAFVPVAAGRAWVHEAREVALSPDGRSFVHAFGWGAAVRDAADGSVVSEIRWGGDDAAEEPEALLLDAEELTALRLRGSELLLDSWSVPDGTHLAAIATRLDRSELVGAAPDLRQLVVSVDDTEVHVVDLGTGAVRARLEDPWGTGLTRSIDRVLWLPGDRLLARLESFEDAGAFLEYDRRGRLVRRDEVHLRPVTELEASADGSRVLTLGHDEGLRLWSAAGRPLAFLPDAWCSGLALSPDGTRVACAWPGAITVWSPEHRGPPRDVLECDGCHWMDVAWAPDGGWLAAVSDDGCVERVTPSGDPLPAIRTCVRSDRYDDHRLAVSPDGTAVLVADGAGGLTTLEVATGAVLGTGATLALELHDLRWTAQGVVATSGEAIERFGPDLAPVAERLVRDLWGHADFPGGEIWSSDGTCWIDDGSLRRLPFVRCLDPEVVDDRVYLTIRGEASSVPVTEIRTLAIAEPVVAAEDPVPLRIAPSARYGAAAGRPGERHGRGPYDRHPPRVHREGATLLTLGSDGVVRSWDAATGHFRARVATDVTDLVVSRRRVVWREDGSGGLVGGAAVGRELHRDDGPFGLGLAADDRGRIAACTNDGGIALLDAVELTRSGRIESGRGRVNALALSHDGRHVATGLEAGDVRLWDLATGFPVLALGSPGLRERKVVALAFTADDGAVVFATDDGVVAADARDGTVLLERPGTTFDLTGTRLAIRTARGIELWSTEGWTATGLLEGAFDAVAFDGDGRLYGFSEGAALAFDLPDAG